MNILRIDIFFKVKLLLHRLKFFGLRLHVVFVMLYTYVYMYIHMCRTNNAYTNLRTHMRTHVNTSPAKITNIVLQKQESSQVA